MSTPVSITSRTCFRRFNAEIADLLENGHDILNVTYTKTDIKFRLKIDSASQNETQFILTENYPFRPPLISMNDHSYHSHLSCFATRVKNCLRSNYKFDDLLEQTITAGKNWSPAYTIIKLIDEIKIFNSTKTRIKYLICLDEITYYKNIPEDMILVIMGYLQNGNQ